MTQGKRATSKVTVTQQGSGRLVIRARGQNAKRRFPPVHNVRMEHSVHRVHGAACMALVHTLLF